MEKLYRILYVLLIFIYIPQVDAQNWDKYTPDILASYQIGNGTFQLAVTDDPDYPAVMGPSNLSIDNTGKIYIVDYFNSRIVSIDDSYAIDNFISVDLWENYINTLNFYYKDNFFWIYDNENASFIAYDMDGRRKFSVSFINEKLQGIVDDNRYYFDQNIIIQYLKNGNFLGVIDPESKMNNQGNIFLNADQISKYLADNNFNEYSIDEKKNFFVNGKYFSTDFEKYDEYWSECYKKNNLPDNRYDMLPEILLEFLPEIKYRFKYLGTDDNFNTYFAISKTAVYIFNSTGKLIDYFKFDKEYNLDNRHARVIYPAIHPSGDLYFMRYTDLKKCILMRYKNIWDSAGRSTWYSENE